MLTIIINKGYGEGMTLHRAALALLSSSLLVVAGCSATEQGDGSEAPTSDRAAVPAVVEGPSVVVTTTILGSVVGDILTCAVGSDASMTVVMPIGADPTISSPPQSKSPL